MEIQKAVRLVIRCLGLELEKIPDNSPREPPDHTPSPSRKGFGTPPLPSGEGWGEGLIQNVLEAESIGLIAGEPSAISLQHEKVARKSRLEPESRHPESRPSKRVYAWLKADG